MYTQVNHSCCWLFKRTKERNSLFLHQGKQGNERVLGCEPFFEGFQRVQIFNTANEQQANAAFPKIAAIIFYYLEKTCHSKNADKR